MKVADATGYHFEFEVADVYCTFVISHDAIVDVFIYYTKKAIDLSRGCGWLV